MRTFRSLLSVIKISRTLTAPQITNYQGSRKCMSSMSLRGQRCLITGGSRGIGFAIASKFASEGATCVIVGRSAETAESACKQLDTQAGQVHSAVQFDVSSCQRVWTPDDLGGMSLQSIDILVNAAGISQQKLLCFTSPDEIDKIIFTNLLGTIYACRSFSRAMMGKKTDSCIINISSVLASRAARGSSIYAASKAGVEGLTAALATELGPRNVRVNAIRPGLIDTDMVSAVQRDGFLPQVPLARLGTPSEVADTALFLVQNKFCNGTILSIDGGFSTS
ncbi:3-oxoacyl-reductase [Limtongia smithiae]|uniref:3-oxoacyl-reductase n=1 Tax=Limtongia smithiae TaxID=1125753 RepID=UPI0034CD2281